MRLPGQPSCGAQHVLICGQRVFLTGWRCPNDGTGFLGEHAASSCHVKMRSVAEFPIDTVGRFSLIRRGRSGLVGFRHWFKPIDTLPVQTKAEKPLGQGSPDFPLRERNNTMGAIQ